MASLSAANVSFQHKWIVLISGFIGLSCWILFFGSQEDIVGLQIASLFSNYEIFLKLFIGIFGVLSIDMLIFPFRDMLPKYFSAIFSLIVLLSILKFASVAVGLVSVSAVFLSGLLFDSIGLQSLLNYRTAAVEVHREVKRIHWPSHPETLKFVGVVAAFVTVSSIFWWIIDGVIARVLSFLLHILS